VFPPSRPGEEDGGRRKYYVDDVEVRVINERVRTTRRKASW